MGERRRKFWGWGCEDEGPSHEQQERIAALLAARFTMEPTLALSRAGHNARPPVFRSASWPASAAAPC